MKKLLTICSLFGFTAFYAQITITANIPSISAGSSAEAEIKISKGTVTNFAKYQMDVPAGIIVTAVDAKSGNFTFENQRAKIVWVSIPSDAEFTIKLKIQAASNAPNPSVFNQKFYYLENSEKKEAEAPPVSVIINGGSGAVASAPAEPSTPAPTETKPAEQPVASTPTETKPVETTPAKPAEQPVASAPTETKPAEQPVESTPTETKPIETAPAKPAEQPVASAPTETKPAEPAPSTNNARTTASEDGMTYKVQIGAFSSQPSKSKYSGLSNVSIDMINGLYKVTVGKFNSKEEAVKYRDELQSKGFNGGFIAKYKNGVRIN
ncbi:MAG: SPOR domain-containing protein [Bacteroidia bacterium]|nr:SPOR domain-containing protein [Bacteroidia bacterium]